MMENISIDRKSTLKLSLLIATQLNALIDKFNEMDYVRSDKPFGDYTGCQKNVPFHGRFFLQPYIPRCIFSEHNFEKRYKILKLYDLFTFSSLPLLL